MPAALSVDHDAAREKLQESTFVAERLTSRAESAGAASISSCSCATQFLAICTRNNATQGATLHRMLQIPQRQVRH